MRPFDFEDDEREDGTPPEESAAPEPTDGTEEEWRPATWAGRRASGSEAGADDEADAPNPADESPEPPDEFAFSDDEEADDAGGEEDDFGDEDDPAAGGDPVSEPQPTGGNTLETDTVAEADREQARESALSGLRARAAESAARRGGSGAGAAAGVGAAAAAARSKPAAGSVPPPSSSPAARIGKTSIDPAAADQAGPPGGKPPSRRSLWARFAAASAICVFSMAAATAISLLVLLTSVAEGLGDSGELANLGGQLEGVDGGEPQTIMILGSDKRSNTPGDPGRSDTTILLRIDPDKQAISLMSIPRDLQVAIPGYEDAGEVKFNEAYTLGGPELTLRTVKDITGLNINHVVNIDFLGFADAVNEIGCVYIDADRRYFVGENDPRDYSAVNIKAGYQRMCGYNALGYVRYRIGDDDLVRAARQQEFLREARQKVPPEVLIQDRDDLLKVFTDYTTSDIDSGVTLLEFIKTLVRVGSAPINEVHFPATPDPDNPANLVASSEAIATAVDEFMVTEGTPGPPDDPEIDSGGDGGSGNGGGGGGGDGGGSDEPSGPELIDSSDSGLASADQLAKGKFEPPIYYPTRLMPESAIVDDSRWFPIDGPSDEIYYGYKFVVELNDETTFPRYYGVSGTTWKDAPILENESEVREIEGRNYKLYYDGDRIRMVAFETDDAAYWVSNTLTQELTNDEMIAIATGLQER